MYIAQVNICNRIRYIIRESVPDPTGEYFISQDLFDLGDDPTKFINYFGRNSFHIDSEVEEIVDQKRTSKGGPDLEELFGPFLQPEVRHQAEFFSHKYRNFSPKTLSAEDITYINQRVHLFDKKRLYYLRFGALNQTRLHKAPPKMFMPLLYKSRDELEQFFFEQESVLEPTEFRQYVYVIFDLQRFFSETAALSRPEALDQNRLDEVFEPEFCGLLTDKLFVRGINESVINRYLSRYLIMFFDYDFPTGSFEHDYARQFMDDRRSFSFPKREVELDEQEVRDLFGVSKEELGRMSKSRLTVLYRQVAHEHHPDKGGEHDDFVRLTELYQQIRKTKK
ncbi:MAG: hypothetical protein ABFS18_13055 [Thermodesulfobacteriota bacterium]